MIEAPQGRISEGATILYQCHIRGHLGYGLNAQAVMHGEIATLNHSIETVVKENFKCTLSEVPNPIKFASLRDEYPDLRSPLDHKPIVRAIIRRLSGQNAGTADVITTQDADKILVLEKIARCPEM